MNQAATPLVSFVVPCYNYARYLPDCLNGIFGQEDHQNFEIIAVDDGSTDNTLEVLGAVSDPRLRVIAQGKNQGHIVTVNRGLEEARGKYVVRVDPDDRHRPCFLKETLPKLEQYPEVGLVFGDVALIDQHGQITVERSGMAGDRDRKGNELTRILQHNYICAPTVIARRAAWMEAWPIPKGLAFNDWYFNVMLARRQEYYFVNKVLADYRVHSQNHHSKISRDKSEETSVLWVLDKVYAETEQDPKLERDKQDVKQLAYARHYLDFADKYFGAKMNDDAKRCYFEAIRRRPQLLRDPGVVRRMLATVVGRELYEHGKALWRTHLP